MPRRPLSPVLPDIEEQIEGPGAGQGHWVVIVYDNDHNTFDEVILILMTATGCGLDEAQLETWEIHNLGRSVVHHGGEGECRAVARVIATIGIRVEVAEE